MDSKLKTKIEALFTYRGFPELYAFAGITQREQKNLNAKLIDLQAQIYHLDSYLEKNWDLSSHVRSNLWNNIRSSLQKLDIPPSEIEKYLTHIKKYERHEMQLRQNLMPTRFSTEYYYYYKSCDVKLIRKLILQQLPPIKKLFLESDWRYFDLVTEVNDDATDLEEDMHTINGNMVLISFFQEGRDATIQRFNLFLDYCAVCSEHRFKDTKSKYKKLIHQKTKIQIAETKKLLQTSNILQEKSMSALQKFTLNNRA